MSLVIAGNASGGYNLTKSLRFRSSASAYMNRTPSTTTNRTTWTWSGWVKRSKLGVFGGLFGTDFSASVFNALRFTDTDTLSIFEYDVGTSTTLYRLDTTQVFRDPSGWYHIVFAFDSTQATASNRSKLYVNGVQVTALTTATYPSLNYATLINTATVPENIGQVTTSYFDGYMAEVNFVDGQQLTPSSVGETDSLTGVWKPKAYSGTYGTNGFYLKFTDVATTSGSNAGLGKDFSGNGNYWTTNNISVTAGATYDSMTDVPTLTSATAANYAVMNPLNSASTLSNANLTGSIGTATWYSSVGTIGVTSGKWYWELVYSGTFTLGMVGIGSTSFIPAVNIYPGIGSDSYGYFSSNGNKYNNGSNSAYGASYTTGDVIGVALDMDAGTLTFYKNNSSQGTAYTGLSGTFVPAFGSHNSTVNANFGQQGFTYSPPTGYKALNTYNLPDSTIVAGNKVMDATLWTGNGTSQTVTNAAAFKPDLVWAKNRGTTNYNVLTDSVRGVQKDIYSNTTDVELTASGGLTAFNSNGFSIGTNANWNNNTYAFVGWQWQAGQGTNTTNTSGSITSTVSVNASAGFSIVTYTGSGGNDTVGHGLGVAPKMIITKPRNTAGTSWVTGHQSLNGGVNPWNCFLVLNGTGGQTTSTNAWNNTAPTSSVFTSGSGFVGAGYTMVAYCWAEVAGFSQFGSYTGNGSSDGPFIYTGFRPKFVMVKRTDSTSNWNVTDTSRDLYNPEAQYLQPNTSNAEATFVLIDGLSNGFKNRSTDAAYNASGGTYIYMAFAENPFRNSLAR